MLRTLTCAAVMCVAVAAGCASDNQGFKSAATAERLRAIKEAGRDDDQSKIPQLITMLQSDDAAVRLLAIRTLERITGRGPAEHGYDYAAPEADRHREVESWAQWYNQRQTPGEPPVARREP